MMLSLFSACGSDDGEEVTIVNVACRNDYQEIWDAVNEELADENIKVINTAYDTSVNLNELLVAGDIDMNVAQHYAYLEFVKGSDAKFADLTSMGELHIATLDLYSNKYDSVEDIPDGSTISIPNDYMNGGRALLLLEKAGVLTLDKEWEDFPDYTNIVENPKNLEFLEIASDSMVITLDDVAAGFVYSINAVDGGLDPIEDPIFRDAIDFDGDPVQRGFIIVFTVNPEDVDNEVFQKVVEAYHAESVYKVYKEVYNNSMIPVDDGNPIDLSKY